MRSLHNWGVRLVLLASGLVFSLPTCLCLAQLAQNAADVKADIAQRDRYVATIEAEIRNLSQARTEGEATHRISVQNHNTAMQRAEKQVQSYFDSANSFRAKASQQRQFAAYYNGAANQLLTFAQSLQNQINKSQADFDTWETNYQQSLNRLDQYTASRRRQKLAEETQISRLKAELPSLDLKEANQRKPVSVQTPAIVSDYEDYSTAYQTVPTQNSDAISTSEPPLSETQSQASRNLLTGLRPAKRR
jgi:chromosome segregation ATPase